MKKKKRQRTRTCGKKRNGERKIKKETPDTKYKQTKRKENEKGKRK